MKKCSVFLMMLAFLVVITSGNVIGSPSVFAQEDGQSSKINSLLSLQVETKLHSMEAEAAPAATPALEPGSEPEPVPTQPINRWLIVGIITGIILIGVASYYFIKKKRGTV